MNTHVAHFLGASAAYAVQLCLARGGTMQLAMQRQQRVYRILK